RDRARQIEVGLSFDELLERALVVDPPARARQAWSGTAQPDSADRLVALIAKQPVRRSPPWRASRESMPSPPGLVTLRSHVAAVATGQGFGRLSTRRV